ncbi:putative bifunctional diguanylate cyclase/phosphodiesterase [Rhodocyclus tenuis]|uniref:Diguanylate cyclase (GGDEF)-like protein/PAS domain S-box-containing protein n=1 Tax=Rhodocyclus tenuis TaxID=1066 RepID=A0A840GGX7_RHOTE|nr:EAL domain-containing protein [Rhodocyclus tenuis]MBB4247752.1 diguanylate cyclase (GGDEF)-like protein/PAS domain S-box-containing protein [Rhodocyclus tenuis]
MIASLASARQFMSAAPPMPPAGDSSREPELNAQLFRYAEDLQQMLERQIELEADYKDLLKASIPLAESRNQLNGLIDRSPDMHIVTDSEGRVLRCNPATAMLGRTEEIIGSLLRHWLSPTHLEQYEALQRRALLAAPGEAEDGTLHELKLCPGAPPGTSLIVAVQALPVLHEGKISSVHWIMHDVTRQREAQFASQISSAVFRSAAEGVVITDINGSILSVNPSFCRITGYSASEAIGRKPGELLASGVHDEAFYAAFWQSLRETGNWQGEIYNRRKSGEVYPEWLTVSAVRNEDGAIESFIAVFADLSHIFDETQQRVAYLAHHDMLTTLPNRLLFHERLQEVLAQEDSADNGFTVILLDLDRFKQVNVAFGPHVGDGVLQEVARRLLATVHKVDTLARFGGNEFAIIASGMTGEADIGCFCAKLLGALRQPMAIDGRELFICSSLGCATYPAHGHDEGALLKSAAAAMYHAKTAGGNTYSLHDVRGAVDDGTLPMETELRRALERGQLRLEYQPQVATRNGALVGVEALLRWQHPHFGEVSPEQFIPVAEAAGLIGSIGEWVLHSACRQLAAWDDQGVSIASMGVNLSPRQLRDPAIVDKVRAALTASGIAAARLELEVTESEMLFQLDADRYKLAALRDLGVKIAIDDFGSGYSSLGRLLQLKIDRLKLDRCFVLELEPQGDTRAGAITAAILSLGEALGVELVVEGVETEAQFELLSRQGFQVIQGYLTGRPMSPAAVAQRFTEFAGRSEAGCVHG